MAPHLRGFTALLMLAAASPAWASSTYLFNASQNDIDEIFTRYVQPHGTYSKSDLESTFTSPFTCSKYGSLCNFLGDSGAEDYLEEVFVMAKNGASEEDLGNYAAERARFLRAAYLHEKEDVIGQSQSYFWVSEDNSNWNVTNAGYDPDESPAVAYDWNPPQTCPATFDGSLPITDTEEATSGLVRVRTTAFWWPLIVFNNIGVETSYWVRPTTTAAFSLADGDLAVFANFQGDWGLGGPIDPLTGNGATTCNGCDDRFETARVLDVMEWGVGIPPAANRVSGFGGSPADNLGREVSNSAPWAAINQACAAVP